MFIDISGSIASNRVGNCGGVAVADLDGDGRVSVIVAGFGVANRVLKWSGHVLRETAPPFLADVDRKSTGIAAADFDGDGREEIYVLSAEAGTDRLFDQLPDGEWVDLFSRSENATVRNGGTGRSACGIDRRGNGRYSFIVANSGRPLRLYELAADGTITDLAPALGVNLTAFSRSLLVAPLASSRPDIFCANERGPNFLFRNTGMGTFLEVAAEHRLADSEEHGRGSTVLDADGDGRFDICYGNSDGPHRLMLRQPDGTFKNAATLAMALPSAIRTVIAADFDNDGYEELFFNNLGEPNRLFRQTRDGWMHADIGAATEYDDHGTGAAIADFDGDGRLELLIAHGDAKPLTMYRGPENDNGWIRVRPLTRFGAPARGAVVKLIANGRAQVRVICGGSGYMCQMEPVAHFGLGTSATIDSVTITWPDASSITILKPAIRQVLIAKYPGSG